MEAILDVFYTVLMKMAMKKSIKKAPFATWAFLKRLFTKKPSQNNGKAKQSSKARQMCSKCNQQYATTPTPTAAKYTPAPIAGEASQILTSLLGAAKTSKGISFTKSPSADGNQKGHIIHLAPWQPSSKATTCNTIPQQQSGVGYITAKYAITLKKQTSQQGSIKIINGAIKQTLTPISPYAYTAIVNNTAPTVNDKTAKTVQISHPATKGFPPAISIKINLTAAAAQKHQLFLEVRLLSITTHNAQTHSKPNGSKTTTAKKTTKTKQKPAPTH